MNAATAESGNTIVVIDDVADMVEATVLLLNLEGLDAVGAVGGIAGLHLATDLGARMVLLDYKMPVMSGAEVGHALRRHPRTHRALIVMHSSSDESAVRQTFPDYDAFIPKPTDADALLRLVTALLGGQRTERPS